MSSSSTATTSAPPGGARFDHVLKLILLGNSHVGKSSILLRFTDDKFDEEMVSTIGVDLKVKFVDVERPSGETGSSNKKVNKKLKLICWDTAGQERFRTLTSSYYRNVHGAILVYDVANEESFENLEHWLKEIEVNSGNAHVVKILVGNKADLEESRKIPKAQGLAFAREHGMLFLETSVKNNTGIQQVFFEVINQILDSPDLVARSGGDGAASGTKKSASGVNVGNQTEGDAEGGGLGCC